MERALLLRSLASRASHATFCPSPLPHHVRLISSSVHRSSPDVAESALGDAIVGGGTMRTINDSPANPTTKIQIMIRSYEPIQNLPWELPPHTREINLPPSRRLYTVIRGPHVHKSSREQFESKIYKKVLVMNAERHELRKKFFWLKRQRMFGAQFEILFSYKTRLDKGILQRILQPEDSLKSKGVSEKSQEGDTEI